MTDGFFGARGDSFAAKDAAELRARLDEIDTTVPRRTEGRTAEHRERYCVVHYLRTLERNGLLQLPFKITKGENQQGLTELENAASDSVLEGTQIRRPGEALRGRPYAGDEPERLWTAEVLETIEEKTALLPTYQELPDYQLLLYDNTEMGALTEWTVTELPERLAAAIREWRETEPGGERRFSRISVLRDRVLMYDVTGSAFLLPVPPSPSLAKLRSLTRLGVSEEDLQDFSRRHRIRKLGFFGSVADKSDRFGPRSDVDVLVEFEPGHRIGFIGLAGVELELSELLGRKVDLRTVPDLNRYFREEVVRKKTDVAYARATG